MTVPDIRIVANNSKYPIVAPSLLCRYRAPPMAVGFAMIASARNGWPLDSLSASVTARHVDSMMSLSSRRCITTSDALEGRNPLFFTMSEGGDREGRRGWREGVGPNGHGQEEAGVVHPSTGIKAPEMFLAPISGEVR